MRVGQRQPRVGAAVGEHEGEIVERQGVFRIEFQDLAVLVAGSLPLAGGFQREGQRGQDGRICRLQGLRVPQSGNSEIQIALAAIGDRKSTRLNSSHLGISYAVFCLKKKNIETNGVDNTRSCTPGTGSACASLSS